MANLERKQAEKLKNKQFLKLLYCENCAIIQTGYINDSSVRVVWEVSKGGAISGRGCHGDDCN